MKPTINLKLIPAKTTDSGRILAFLQKYYHPHEPLNASINRIPEDESGVFALRYLDQGHSYLAINTLDESKDNWLGVILNGEEVPIPEGSNDELIEHFQGTDFLEIMKLERKIEHESDVWNKLKVDKVFKVFILAVSSAARGLGIGQQLLTLSEARAASNGYSYITVDCSSIFSAAIARNSGFECIYELKYDEFLNDQGRPAFNVAKPHTCIQVLVKKL